MLQQIKVFSIAEVGNIVSEIPAGLKTITHGGLGCPHVSVFPMSRLKCVEAATFLLAHRPREDYAMQDVRCFGEFISLFTKHLLSND